MAKTYILSKKIKHSKLWSDDMIESEIDVSPIIGELTKKYGNEYNINSGPFYSISHDNIIVSFMADKVPPKDSIIQHFEPMPKL